MLRKLLTTALLCLICQTVQAQTNDAALNQAIRNSLAKTSTNIPNYDSIRLFYYQDTWASEPVDGRKYVLLHGYYFRHMVNSRSVEASYFTCRFVWNGSSYSTYSSIKFKHPLTGETVSVTILTGMTAFSGFPNIAIQKKSGTKLEFERIDLL